MSRLLREARLSRGWSSTDLRRELARAAARMGVAVASDASLRVLISRWENGRATPEGSNRLLLQEVLGLDAEALGLPAAESEHRSGVTAFVSHAARRAGPPPAVLEYFDRQLGEHARVDNLAGPNYVLATVEGQLQQVEQLASDGGPELAHLAARYSEFAGWLHQDVGNDAEALRLTSRAVDLAEIAGDGELTTYNRMRKANVLSGRLDLPLAAATAEAALADATERFPNLVPVCLRQSALTFARMRDERSARAAIERAVGMTSSTVDGAGVLSPYCTTSYVQMEAALCLLMLRQPLAAEAACREALTGWPAELVRDRTLCLARRGIALVELREVDEACGAALDALDGVRSAPSGRVLYMLRLIATRLRPFGRKARVRELTDALAEVA